MAKSKSARWAEVFQQAHKELSESVDAVEGEREQCLEDRRFYSIAGAMWEGATGELFENRPMLEVNKVHLAVIRIINEFRNNRISAVFQPRDGSTNDELSDLCAGLYRADQYDSHAEEAQDNAFEEAVGGGFGAWRLINEYEDEEDEESEDQRIRFEPIYDADSTVFFDPGAKRQDKSDANYCFVLTGMSRDKYRDEYGEEPSSFDRPIDGGGFDWTDGDLVYVAEYYRVESVGVTVYKYRDIEGGITKYTDADFENDEGLAQRLDDIGTIRISSRQVKRRKVRKYILSGDGVLEDCGHIAGTEIPIVPVYGKRWYVDGKERCMGHVRLAKDAQRLKNMQLSVLAEISAFGGVDTPIVTPEQIAGHESKWARYAIDRPAALPLNPITQPDGSQTPSGPVGIKTAPQIPPAMAALLQISEEDIADILGNQDGGEQIESNLSGRAVELIQSRLDEQTRIYITNYAKAERRSAQIWLSMARELYADAGRKMKVINDQDETDSVEVGRKVIGENGEPVLEADLAGARLDVTVDVGPSSSSRRSATVRALTEMLPMVADPMDQKVLSAMALMNMEGEGIGPVREYFRAQMVQMGVVEPTDKELEEIQAAKSQANEPSAQDQFLMAETEKSLAEAQKVASDIQKAEAGAALDRARTAKTLADIDRDAAQTAIDAASLAAGTATMTPEVMRQAGPRPDNAR